MAGFVQVNANVRVRPEHVAAVTEAPLGVETVGGTYYEAEGFVSVVELLAAIEGEGTSMTTIEEAREALSTLEGVVSRAERQENYKAVADSLDSLVRAVMEAMGCRPDQDPVIFARELRERLSVPPSDDDREALAELRLAAEAQRDAYARMLELGQGVGMLGVRHPEMFEAMLAWGERSENEHADTVLDLIDRLDAAIPIKPAGQELT